jgi:hypothetical protein
MRPVFVTLLLSGLLACSDSTGSGGDPNDQTIDDMRLVNLQSFFADSSAYDVAAYWKAYNAAGRELALRDSTTGAYINRALRYGINDSVAARSILIDTSGTVTLLTFTGRLYLFAPTARSPRELMGFHVMTVSQ